MIGERFGNILLCYLPVNIQVGNENDPSFYYRVEEKHHNERHKSMKYNGTHIVPLGYLSLALVLVSIQRSRTVSLL
jgi:hypothetical protein